MSSQSTATLNAASDSVPLAGVRSLARPLTLILATLTTGLISGFFYAYACSVTLGLALLPDEQYIQAMQAINATVRNGVFAFSFFGARGPHPAIEIAPLPAHSASHRALHRGRLHGDIPGERADERTACPRG